jgi:hypothetical protein
MKKDRCVLALTTVCSFNLILQKMRASYNDFKELIPATAVSGPPKKLAGKLANNSCNCGVRPAKKTGG